MTVEELHRLIVRRWGEARAAVGIPDEVDMVWEIGPYPHFRTSRGYAVAISNGDDTYRLRLARKILDAPRHRVEGLLRHELGHMVDYVVPRKHLDAWGRSHSVPLAATDERRADDIARAVWGEPIRYDDDLVQSIRHGVSPRPEHLGL
jgi:hypothetical protein